MRWFAVLAFKVVVTLLSPFMVAIAMTAPNARREGVLTVWGDILVAAWQNRNRRDERLAQTNTSDLH